MSIQTTSESVSPKTWAIVIWCLYLAGFLTAFMSTLVGAIIAYVKRPDLAGTPYESHMVSAVRTFWISFIGGLIGLLLSLVLIGFAVMLAVGVWLLFRSIRGLIRAMDGRPIENPTGWL